VWLCLSKSAPLRIYLFNLNFNINYKKITKFCIQFSLKKITTSFCFGDLIYNRKRGRICWTEYKWVGKIILRLSRPRAVLGGVCREDNHSGPGCSWTEHAMLGTAGSSRLVRFFWGVQFCGKSDLTAVRSVPNISGE